ncbi:MAG: glycine dehydrogenase (aminomethyl-transferring) [Thermoplasmata archaeon M9B1D]|nr:MAG: glycine dehydrogenase (aminomethyl-transferring) [Thermoplasmata archaeon M9B1D]
MKFIPNSEIKNEMLKELNLKNINDLFSDIPKEIKINELDIPKGLSQQETEKKLQKIASKNKSYNDMLTFLGGGIKPHYIPAIVKSITSRSEFFTSYTPYQPEASQGFLQAMFEYQSMIAQLTGMDVSNCSLYDGVTAISEAALMCSRITKRNTFVMPHNISWDKKCVLKNYAKGPGLKIKEVPYDDKTGKINFKELKKAVDFDVAGVYIENPNFFGIFEDDVEEINKICKDAGALFVAGVDPISLGIIRSPGEYDADIVIGEGRCLGNPMDYGGSSLGIFSCKKDFIRQMPGRIIGLTKDAAGKRAFCMAFQTREQHIRRARATSNICTNEGLCALAASVYLSWLGGNGLSKLAKTNFEKGRLLAEKLTSINGFKLRFTGSFFNEFVVKCPIDVNNLNKRLLLENIHCGFALNENYPELKDCMLLGVTEIHSDDDINHFVSILREVL